MLKKIEEEANRILSGSKGSHDREHTARVSALALRIAESEGADSEIVHAAALLHDIARNCEDASSGSICHAEKGAEMAKGILKKTGMENAKIDRIVHCIETHRFRGDKKPGTKEARVLFDADKLDSIGAVGIGRAFLFAGEIGAKLHNKETKDIENTKPYTEEDTAYREYMVKLRKIKDRMLTKEGKRLAEERHSFMAGFFERIDKEIDGIL